MSYRGYNFDVDLQMKDAGAITASAAALVGGVARVLDLGAARWEGVLVINTTARDIADGNETYSIQIELSNAVGFGSGNEVFVQIPITALGRVEVPFVNQKYGTGYRYARLNSVLAGTSPSINYTAYASVLKWA